MAEMLPGLKMRPPTLTEVPDLWKEDGALRDIYVVGTTLEDWKLFVTLAMSYPTSYELDGMSASMPDVADVLRSHDHSHLLAVHVGGVLLHCHFFVSSEIEIDIDPREVKTSADHDGVLVFVRELARALGKLIIITPENEMETQIVSYQPSNDTWQ